MVIKARGEAIQSFTAALNKAPHLPDGFSTEDLDETIGEAGVGGKNSKLWLKKERLHFMGGMECDEGNT